MAADGLLSLSSESLNKMRELVHKIKFASQNFEFSPIDIDRVQK